MPSHVTCTRSPESRFGPGTLYGAIARLEKRGLIEPLEADDRRRPYRLTGSGAAALREQLTAREHVASVGLRRLSAAEVSAWRKRLLSLYPAAWRDRYGEEMYGQPLHRVVNSCVASRAGFGIDLG